MRFQSFRAILFFAFAVLPICLLAQVPVKAWLSKDSLLIGEPAQLAIEFTLPLNASPDWYAVPVFPLDEMGLQPAQDSADVLEVILKDGWTKEKEQGELLYRCIFTVTGFEPGQFYLRDIPLGQYNGSLLKAPPVPVLVIAPPAKDLAEIKDIIGDSKVTEWLWYAGVLLVLLLLAALTYLVVKLYQKRKQNPPPPVQLPPVTPLTAYQEALAALTALEKSNYIREHDYKEYYSRLSFILRNYLEQKWTIPALESTTGDMRSLLKGKIKEVEFQQLMEILNAADLVKFAKSIPTATQSERWLQLSRQLLEQLEKV